VPLKYLDFAEKHEGKPFPLSRLFKNRPPIHDAKARLTLLDRNEIDIHVLVPLPWLASFPRVANDRTLATEAAPIVNDEIAAAVATQPQRFRGVALLPCARRAGAGHSGWGQSERSQKCSPGEHDRIGLEFNCKYVSFPL
jgi:hypothetical protein